ncbi:MAG: hypothetical protein KI790_11210 [Cyclobacteriaceae bacterium]|nr:hypothetical protein [Cyclobacteriaceae bacterium HetDA_MAG_MS6]
MQDVQLNGKPHRQYWLDHYDLFRGDNTIEFFMGEDPNDDWPN